VKVIKAIYDETLKNVCKIGAGKECCRYLACGADGFECLKNTPLATVMDNRVKAGKANAQGNNCDGLGKEEAGT